MANVGKSGHSAGETWVGTSLRIHEREPTSGFNGRMAQRIEACGLGPIVPMTGMAKYFCAAYTTWCHSEVTSQQTRKLLVLPLCGESLLHNKTFEAHQSGQVVLKSTFLAQSAHSLTVPYLPAKPQRAARVQSCPDPQSPDNASSSKQTNQTQDSNLDWCKVSWLPSPHCPLQDCSKISKVLSHIYLRVSMTRSIFIHEAKSESFTHASLLSNPNASLKNHGTTSQRTVSRQILYSGRLGRCTRCLCMQTFIMRATKEVLHLALGSEWDEISQTGLHHI